MPEHTTTHSPHVRARRARAGFAASIVAVASLAATSVASAAGPPVTFGFTGAAQTYTVPAGVTSVEVDAYGASGGSSGFGDDGESPGAFGGRTRGVLPVTAGQTLQIFVGGTGSRGTGIGGFNGGGDVIGTGNDDDIGGGGGGGASDVRTGSGFETRLIVAAGGAGSGLQAGGGAGGGTSGENGDRYSEEGDGGRGGSQTTGGAAGFGSAGPPATAGGLGFGGTGQCQTPNGFCGGGGGGGYFGGGGGGGGEENSGGGGGSALVPTGGTTESNVRDGQGSIVVTPRFAPTVAATTPFEGASYRESATVKASYTCSDLSGTGIASCVGTVPNGTKIDTKTRGPKTFTITATDNEGNVTTRTINYRVVSLITGE